MFHLAYSTPRFLAFVVGIASVSAALAEGWVPIGPNDVGMVTSLAGGPTAIYAGTCNGVYRSANGGASWREAGLQRECVIRLAVDARSDTIYAIVDPHFFVSYYPEPSHLLSDFHLGSTLWVSRDGGQTWMPTPFQTAQSVAVDPTEPDTAYVTSYDSYYPLAVTHDSGASWTRVSGVPEENISQVAIDARDGTIYGAGVTLIVGAQGVWSEIPLNVSAIAVGSDADGAVYAAGFEKFCRKSTAAPEWTCNPFPGTGKSIIELPESDSEPRRILVTGFDGVWRSDDDGRSWFPAAGNPAGYTPALALDSSGTVVYAGNDVGVYRSTDRGETWTNSSVGLRSTWVRALVLDPTQPSTIWAGAEGRAYDLSQDVPGLFRSTDAGGSWMTASVAGDPGYVFSLAIDPTDRRNLYAGSFGSVDRTHDGGASWSTSHPSSHFVLGLAVDPASSSRIWAATVGGLKRSNSSGQTWSDSLVAQDIFCLLFDSRRPGTIYAGAAWEDTGYYYPFGTGFAVYTSRNGGDTWTHTGSVLEGAVTSLAIDPFSDTVVYAGTFAGTILRSPDASATWERWDTQSPGYPVLALVADPVRPGRLYRAGWDGVSRSEDGGRSWHLFSEGLSPYGVFGLAVSPDGTWLYAGTTGGGVFQRNLAVVERGTVTRVDRPRAPRNIPPRAPP